MKFTFLRFGVQLVLNETLKHGPDMLDVFFEVLGVYENVVNVDDDPAIEHVPKDVVDKLLEDGGTIG